MKEYSIQRSGHPLLPVIAADWADARRSAESVLEEEAEKPGADGFRWIKDGSRSWMYQVVDEDEKILLKAYLIEKV